MYTFSFLLHRAASVVSSRQYSATKKFLHHRPSLLLEGGHPLQKCQSPFRAKESYPFASCSTGMLKDRRFLGLECECWEQVGLSPLISEDGGRMEHSGNPRAKSQMAISFLPRRRNDWDRCFAGSLSFVRVIIVARRIGSCESFEHHTSTTAGGICVAFAF
jgi:hypothetical protein